MKKENKILAIAILSALLIFVNFLYFNYYLPENNISELSLENIIIEDNEINLSSLTLQQKIGQMIMVRGDEEDLNFNKLNVGGIFLDRQNSEEEYKKLISEYQENPKIKLFVATDLEGAWTPFHNPEPDQIFPKFSEIQTVKEAREVGLNHGELLNQIGFNLNFAPVAEYSDEAYGNRTFSGTNEEIAKKIAAYINGLQTNVLGTCKHYPGKSMKENLHNVSYEIEISQEDLYLFEVCLKNNISSIMVSHQIAKGEVNSNGKPSSVSKNVISKVDDEVLIISDEINMQGLKEFYPDKTEMYIDLINSGENLILDFDLNSYELYKLIKDIEEQVKQGKINREKIDYSVTKILVTKGYEVI